MSTYQSVQAYLQHYLDSLPEGLHLSLHTRTTPTSHFLILQLRTEPPVPDSGPVHIKEEPIETTDRNPVNIKQEPMETTDLKPVQEQETDSNPSLIKREITEHATPTANTTAQLDTPEKSISTASVFSRLGTKHNDVTITNSTVKRCNRRFRRHNKNSWKHNKQHVEDLRTYLKANRQTAPQDLRQILPRRIPVINETAHNCFRSLVSESYYR